MVQFFRASYDRVNGSSSNLLLRYRCAGIELCDFVTRATFESVSNTSKAVKVLQALAETIRKCVVQYCAISMLHPLDYNTPSGAEMANYGNG